tara:strand:- start:16885 stop:17244 length:360 start_codon:yes stop_codon:yes gene_type:complete
MEDIFNAKILCPECNIETERTTLIKKGFQIRSLTCKNCKKTFSHPLDEKRFKDYQKLKNKEFKVKLRMVGNSHTISIPKEIIEFEDRFKQLEKEMDEFIRLSLDEPGKITLFFRKGRLY